MSLLKSSFIVGSLTMLSRVFGFLRDVLIANILGAGMLTDAFFVAFKLPNLLRRLFAEGAFNSAFLPMFAGMLKQDGKAASLHFASQVAGMLGIILVFVSIAAIAFMPYLIMVIAPGFETGSDIFNLTVDLGRITFPYLFFISLVCLLGGVLNSVEKFAAVAATPVLMNLAIIGALIGLRDTLPTGAHALAWGVVFAGIAQFVWLVLACMRSKVLPTPAMPKLTPNVRKLFTLIGPAAIGAGVMQINTLIDMVIASQMDNAISYLYYADRLYELPLGVIGIAVATALLPMLSKQMRSGDKDAAISSMNQSIMLVMLFGLPCAAALFVIADPIIRTVFEHGGFDVEDRLATVPTLVAYAVGLPSFLLIKIFVTSFFASQDTKTPVKIASVCMLLNLCLNLILMQYFAHVGLAIATSITGWTNASLLGFTLYRRGLFVPNPRLYAFIGKSIAASAVMMIVLYALHGSGLADYFVQNTLYRAAALAVLVISGAGVYFGVIAATGAVRPSDIKRMIKPQAAK